MTVSELDKAIKPTMRGAYLFYGEEDYLKGRYREKIREAVLPEDGMEAFNHTVIDDLAKLAGEIEILPMMAERRLVEVNDISFQKLTKDALDSLAVLLKDLPDTVVLFYTRGEEFSPGTVKKPSEAMKKLSETVTIVEFARQSPMKLATWAGKHFAAQHVFASPDLCHTLIERCGTDMYVLAGEIAKVSAYCLAHGATHVTPAMIETVVTPYRESGAFDFVNAIMEGNTARAFLLFSDRRMKKEKPIEILSSISRVVSELLQVKLYTLEGKNQKEIAAIMKKNEYAVKIQQNAIRNRSLESLKRAAALCYETDIKLKSRSIDKYVLIERLIIEMGS